MPAHVTRRLGRADVVTSLVRELLTLAVHVWWSVGRRPRDQPRRGRVHKQPILGRSGRKYLGDTSNVLCPGGRGTDCEGLAGLEKCDPGSPLEEAVDDQDGATQPRWENAVWVQESWPPVTTSKRKRNKMRSDKQTTLQVLHSATASPEAGVPVLPVSLPAGPSSLPQGE